MRTVILAARIAPMHRAHHTLGVQIIQTLNRQIARFLMRQDEIYVGEVAFKYAAVLSEGVAYVFNLILLYTFKAGQPQMGAATNDAPNYEVCCHQLKALHC